MAAMRQKVQDLYAKHIVERGQEDASADELTGATSAASAGFGVSSGVAQVDEPAPGAAEPIGVGSDDFVVASSTGPAIPIVFGSYVHEVDIAAVPVEEPNC